MGLAAPILFFILILFAGHSYATIELISVEGASNFIGIGSNKKDGDSATIFGGTAGTCASTSSDSTCDSCANTSNFETACNQKRVHGDLVLKIKFKSDEVDGVPEIGDSSGNDASITLDSSNTTGNLSKNNEHTVAVLWSSLCSSSTVNSDANCQTDSTSSTITVGVDGNSDGDLADSEDDNTSITIVVKRTIDATTLHCDDASISTGSGICNFEVFPGDEKVFIKQADAPTSFPTGNNPNFYKIRMYLSETGFSDITHASTFIETEFEKEDDGTLKLEEDAVKELTNNTEYFFRMATVDLAENQGFHTPINRSDTSTNFHIQGTHSATPQEVRALLDDTFQCFIATAAFGSPFRKNVEVLRDFRDQFLKTNALGNWFVEAYYSISPPIAKAVAKRPWARSLVRGLLLPVVTLARLTLRWGVLPFLSIMLLGIAALTYGLILIYRKRRSSKLAI